MSESIQGIDLCTGKLLLPLTLASLSGPNGFGEQLAIQYATLDLCSSIKTWNQDAPTGVVGLGWSLAVPMITRLGNGLITDSFLLNGAVLLPTGQSGDADSGYTLTFVTGSQSLNQISYTTANETWTVVDADGTRYIYGGNQACQDDAVVYGVRWVSSNGETPVAWVGPSVSAGSPQQNYVVAWKLAKKENIYGQKVTYGYTKSSQTIGSLGDGLAYDSASYLSKIHVHGGDHLKLIYAPKESWEFPASRVRPEANGSTTAAYQDRFETLCLSRLALYNNEGYLQSTTWLSYGYLWENLGPNIRNSPDYDKINKRILTAVTTYMPDGTMSAPPIALDYWGYSGPGNDGFDYFESHVRPGDTGATEFPRVHVIDLLALSNDDLAGSSFTPPLTPFMTGEGNMLHPLFGHLKCVTSAQGGNTWYSYQDVALNYSSVWDDFNDQWPLRLDLPNIQYPDGKDPSQSLWQHPQPFWGPDAYLVIAWYSKQKVDGYYLLHLDLYEWLGSWQLIDIQGYQDLPVYDDGTTPGTNLISTGQGFFALVRTQMNRDASNNPLGPIGLFSRNPYLSGQWQAEFQGQALIEQGHGLTVPSPGGIPTTVHDMDTQAQLEVGDRIVAVLDKVKGCLYAYGRALNHWHGYQQSWDLGDEGLICMGMAVLNSTIFVIDSDASQGPNYVLIDFDIAHADPRWQEYLGNQTINFYHGSSEPAGAPPADPLISSAQNVLQLAFSNNNGFLTLTAMLTKVDILPAGGKKKGPRKHVVSVFYRPLAISWDQDFVLNAQLIQQDQAWYFPCSWLGMWDWDGAGGLNAFGDNLLFTSSEFKKVYRYTGSGSPGAEGNVGWLAHTFNNNTTNDSYFGNLPLPDATIEVSGSFNLTYSFWQYNPLAQSWDKVSGLESVLAPTKDWTEVIAIIGFSIQVAGMVLMVVAPLGALAESVALGIRAANALMMPLTALTGTLTEAVVPLAYRAMAVPLVENVVGIAENVAQGYLINSLIQSMFSGYSASGSGTYLLAGSTNYQSPQAFYKLWVPFQAGQHDTCQYHWQPIEAFKPTALLYPAPPGQGVSQGLSQSVFYGTNYFQAFDTCAEYAVSYGNGDRMHTWLSTGQVSFFRNGTSLGCIHLPLTDIPAQYLQKDPMFKVYDHAGNPVQQIAYQLGSAQSQLPAFYGAPLMAVPWGGILGFVSAMERVNHGSQGNNDNWYFQGNLQQALSLGLFMVRDEAIAGPVRDYVVDKVLIEDGYQTFSTHLQYMPQQAAFDKAINSVRYNQVRAAVGQMATGLGDTYTASALANGWTEYYFYNGGLSYPTEAGGTIGALPFDPSAETDNDFIRINRDRTNAQRYQNLMVGLLYCQRSLKSVNEADYSIGYEMARQQTFYKAFINRIYAGGTTPIGSQQVMGVLPTLTSSYTAATDVAVREIFQAVKHQRATLTYTYSFYDTDGFYGPLSPVLSTGNDYSLGLQSALPLATLRFNYNYNVSTSSQGETLVEAIYTQSFPGLAAVVLGQVSAYQPFVDLNLCNPVVQTQVWLNNDVNVPTLGAFPSPGNAWPDDNWQVVAASAATWAAYGSLWCPQGQFVWQGETDGSPLTTAEFFAWASPPDNTPPTAWVNTATVSEIEQGVVLEQLDAIGTPYATLYDTSLSLPLARFGNASSSQGLAVYCGFEPYEDLTAWKAPVGTHFASLLHTTDCYTGTRCLHLGPGQSADWTGKPIEAALLPETLMVGLYCKTNSSSGVVTLLMGTASTNVNLPSTQGNWSYQLLPIQMSTLIAQNQNAPAALVLEFANQDTGTDNLLIDNVFLMPLLTTHINISVYDPTTHLLSASIDTSGFTRRYVYDQRRRLVGTVEGAAEVQMPTALGTLYFSRFGNGDQFKPADPNSQASLASRTGGQLYDFRAGEWGRQGWSGGQILNRTLVVQPTESAASLAYPLASQTMPTYGYGLRAQLTLPTAAPLWSTQAGDWIGQPVLDAQGNLYGLLRQPGVPPEEMLDRYLLVQVPNNGAGSVPKVLGSLLQDPAASSTLPPSTRCAVDANGNVYLTYDQSQIIKFASGQQYQIYSASPASLEVPIGPDIQALTNPVIGPDGTLYVADISQGLLVLDAGQPNQADWPLAFPEPAQCDNDPTLSADGQTLYLGLSTASGGLVWAVNLAAQSTAWQAVLPAAVLYPPCLDQAGTVFVVTAGNQLYAIGSDGSPLWEAALGSAAQPCASPLIAHGADLVYVLSNDMTVRAYQRDNGVLRWTQPVPGSLLGTPCVDAAGNLYLSYADPGLAETQPMPAPGLYALTPAGMPLWGQPWLPANAAPISAWGLSLDYTQSQYAQIPANDSFNFTVSQDFTIEGWFNPSDIQDTSPGILSLIEKWDDSTSGFPFAVRYRIDPVPGASNQLIGCHSDGQNYNAVIVPVATNQDQHFAFVKAGQQLSMYINGVLRHQLVDPFVTGNTQNSSDLYFGYQATNDSTYFNGSLAEVRFWNYARSDIANLMNQRLTGAEAGLIGYWLSDQGSSLTTLYDRTGINAPGTLNNGASWSQLGVTLGYFSGPLLGSDESLYLYVSQGLQALNPQPGPPPAACMQLGDLGISYAQGQYSVLGLGDISPVSAPAAADWLLFIAAGTLYFYADGQQLFALSCPQIPSGPLSLGTAPTADTPVGFSNILLFQEPILSASYSDGAGKPRQQQVLAELQSTGA